MPISFYMDEHIPKAITLGLRMRGVDVLTAQEDGKEGNSDPALLDRACTLRRVLFTFDDVLLSEATERQRAGKPFCGVVYAHPLQSSIGVRGDMHLDTLLERKDVESLNDLIHGQPDHK